MARGSKTRRFFLYVLLIIAILATLYFGSVAHDNYFYYTHSSSHEIRAAAYPVMRVAGVIATISACLAVLAGYLLRR